MTPPPRSLAVLASTLLAAACYGSGSATAPAATVAVASPAAAAPAGRCLVGAEAYLRARLRGSLDLDLSWNSAEIECDGGARPDGRGLRVMIAGPRNEAGRRMRFVFGIADTPEGVSVTARPTNVTIIFEGEQRMYATRGDRNCTVDELRQERVGGLGSTGVRSWRVVARGFCVAPATAVDGPARVLVTRFDFASRVDFGEDGGHATPPGSS